MKFIYPNPKLSCGLENESKGIGGFLGILKSNYREFPPNK